MHDYARRGVNICITPTTEGFLGDGFPDLDTIDTVCLGTDCNNRLCFLEEMRWLAFCQNVSKVKYGFRSKSCFGLIG